MNEKMILFFDGPDMSGARVLKYVGDKTSVEIDGLRYLLRYPAYYERGIPVYILIKGYPNSVGLRASDDFEDLMESYPFHMLQRELDDYLGETLFRRRINMMDIFLIILLCLVVALATWIAAIHIYALGIFIPAFGIRKKGPKKEKRKRAVEYKYKRVVDNPEKLVGGYTTEDSLFLLALRLANTLNIHPNEMAHSVGWAEPLTRPLLEFYTRHGVDRKKWVQKYIKDIISIRMIKRPDESEVSL